MADERKIDYVAAFILLGCYPRINEEGISFTSVKQEQNKGQRITGVLTRSVTPDMTAVSYGFLDEILKNSIQMVFRLTDEQYYSTECYKGGIVDLGLVVELLYGNPDALRAARAVVKNVMTPEIVLKDNDQKSWGAKFYAEAYGAAIQVLSDLEEQK